MAENRGQLQAIDSSEGFDILDETAQRLLGMSGKEFLTAFDNGEDIDGDHTSVMKVSVLVPLAR